MSTFFNNIHSLAGQGAIGVTSLPTNGANFMRDSNKILDSMAFLIGELEKQDPTLYAPLTSTTYPRDIYIETGGGFVDFTSNYFVGYSTSSPNANGLIGGQSTAIPVMQADISKDVQKVYTWAHILKVPYIDEKKLAQIGRNLEQILDDGIKLNYNKTLDSMAYTGFADVGSYGLVNNPNVATSVVAVGASASTLWVNKTPDEVLFDVNDMINDSWVASEYDLSGMINHILIPPENFAYIVTAKVSAAGNMSILQYLMENNIAKYNGINLQIFPSRWCKGAGIGGTNRMVGYVNNRNRTRFNLPVPIMRALTQPSVTDMAYLTSYVAQMGETVFLYLQPPQYRDGI